MQPQADASLQLQVQEDFSYGITTELTRVRAADRVSIPVFHVLGCMQCQVLVAHARMDEQEYQLASALMHWMLNAFCEAIEAIWNHMCYSSLPSLLWHARLDFQRIRASDHQP